MGRILWITVNDRTRFLRERSCGLRDVANVRDHKGTLERPVDRLAADQAAMLPYEPALGPLEAAARLRLRTPLPVESLQHPLSVYGELLAEAGR